ncbi:hypothetical protein [Pseudomonas sp. ZL2]
MAKQTINLGTPPTGVGGDTPRSAFGKAQANFDELYGVTGNLKSAAFAAIVGTVSQAGGVPSGALMEVGSNANGEYFKYACGMQICIKRNFNIPGFVIAPGAMGGSSLYPFPAPFVDVPAKSFSGYVSDGGGARTGISLIDDSPMNGGSIDGWRFYIKNTTATNTQIIYACHLIAIGRWF